MSAYLKAMTLRQWLGWIMLVLSCLAWLAVPVVPFLPIDLAVKGSLTVGLIIFAEITGWGCLPLLGPEIAGVIRSKWQQVKRWFTGQAKSEHDL